MPKVVRTVTGSETDLLRHLSFSKEFSPVLDHVSYQKLADLVYDQWMWCTVSAAQSLALRKQIQCSSIVG